MSLFHLHTPTILCTTYGSIARREIPILDLQWICLLLLLRLILIQYLNDFSVRIRKFGRYISLLSTIVAAQNRLLEQIYFSMLFQQTNDFLLWRMVIWSGIVCLPEILTNRITELQFHSTCLPSAHGNFTRISCIIFSTLNRYRCCKTMSLWASVTSSTAFTICSGYNYSNTTVLSVRHCIYKRNLQRKKRTHGKLHF